MIKICMDVITRSLVSSLLSCITLRMLRAMFVADITCITCQGRGMTIRETRYTRQYNPDETWPGLQSSTAPFYFSSGWTQAGHSSTNMVILYPAYRNWEGLLMYQLFVRVQRWRPIPLRQLFYPVFVIPRCSATLAWHTDWHRCLDTRWVGLCSSLSQGKFLCCSRLPQTRVDCVTHVTHWDTIARQANSSENENLSTLWFVFASLSTWSEKFR